MSDTPHQRPSSRPRLVLLALVSAGLVTGCSKTAENGPTSSSTKPPANTGPAEANAEVTSTSPAADATPKKMQRRIVHAWDGVTMLATILITGLQFQLLLFRHRIPMLEMQGLLAGSALLTFLP